MNSYSVKHKLIILILFLLTGCQFRANKINWKIVEFGADSILFAGNQITTGNEGYQIYTPPKNMYSILQKFIYIVQNDKSRIVGLMPEHHNPTYKQGVPAIYDHNQNEFKSCPEAPLFWDIEFYKTDQDKVLVFGDTFDGLIIYDMTYCKTIEVLQQKHSNKQVAGISWNPKLEKLAFSIAELNTSQPLLYIFDLKDYIVSQLTDGSFPRWSPKDNKIAYKKSDTILGIIDMDTFEIQQYEIASHTSMHHPSIFWNDEGDKIVFDIETQAKLNEWEINLVVFDVTTKKAIPLRFYGFQGIWISD